MASPLMVIVGADKGGVGKTTVARAAMDFIARGGRSARAIDTEPGGVFRRFYPQAELLDPNKMPDQMKMIDGAEIAGVTLVDARAGLLTPMIRAFSRMNLLADVKGGELRMMVLHIVGASVASTGEIPVIDHGFSGARVVHVKNKTNPDAVFGPIPGVEIPYLDEEAWGTVDRLGVGFMAFAADKGQSRTLRGYVNAWLDDCFAAFDQAGLGALLKEG